MVPWYGHWLQVREALMTSALLQLPMGMSATEKAARVDAVLDMLVSELAVQRL